MRDAHHRLNVTAFCRGAPMSAKDIVERLERIRLYAQDLLENGHLFGGAIGNVMAIRDEADAIKARIEADAARIAKLERERDFEQSSRLTSEAQLGTVISNLEVKLARAEALLAERNETGQKPGQQSRTKCTPADEQSGETRPAERATGEAAGTPAEFNVNDTVWVRLNDEGRRALRENYARDMPEPIRAKYPYREPTEDCNGWSRWQLHHLMYEFGSHMTPGSPPPFQTTIRLSRPTPPPHPDEALMKALREHRAVKWLLGEGPDDEGHWFGDAPAPRVGAFWWRSTFLKLLEPPQAEALSQYGSKP
jgi:hypothetical protein